jgi:uncharacterized peroxidase-related enzyme
MPFIRWVDDADATGQVAEIYSAWREKNPQRSGMAGILKCFSPNPDFLQAIIDFSYPLHFTDGHLTRRQKEMIATYVSGLNQCLYWKTAHAKFLQLQGGEEELTAALSRGDLKAALLNDAEHGLLEWVRLMTLEPYRNTAEDVDRLRTLGWNDAQIAEAAYITALFAFFNRVADAFGLEEWRP